MTAIFEVSGNQVSECYASSQNWNVVSKVADDFKLELTGPFVPETVRVAWNNHFLEKLDGRATLPVDSLIELECPPGSVFRRMARPILQHPNDPPSTYPCSPRELSELAQSVTELEVLVARLDEICRVVDPSGTNLEVTGTQISECLVLACIAIENHLRLILERNDFKKARYSTKDYILTADPMKLRDYNIAFERYPWLNLYSPFLEWSASAPTISLPWFDRYNSAKHNRYSLKDKPKLNDCFEALSALLILLIGQFGLSRVLRSNTRLREAMSVAQHPIWPSGQLYSSPLQVDGRSTWQRVPYKFSGIEGSRRTE